MQLFDGCDVFDGFLERGFLPRFLVHEASKNHVVSHCSSFGSILRKFDAEANLWSPVRTSLIRCRVSTIIWQPLIDHSRSCKRAALVASAMSVSVIVFPLWCSMWNIFNYTRLRDCCKIVLEYVCSEMLFAFAFVLCYSDDGRRFGLMDNDHFSLSCARALTRVRANAVDRSLDQPWYRPS